MYEFWPSDLAEIFRQAGIPRRLPPPYEPGCNKEDMSSRGSGPQITSPREGVVYSLRAASLKDERVPLTAVTDADTKTIHWFVNEEYLGSPAIDMTFFWAPKTGKFMVRAVDDHGRSAVRAVVTKIVE